MININKIRWELKKGRKSFTFDDIPSVHPTWTRYIVYCNMLHLLTHFNTLINARTLLLLFPLLFGGGCEARNATAIQSSHPEINTFFGTTSFSERSRPYSRFNPDSLFSQIPPTIKWDRVVSLTNSVQVPSRPSLPKKWGDALLIAPYNESERGTFHLLDRRVVKSTLTNRTIFRSKKTYLEKYSRPISSCPDPLTSVGKLDKVWRNGLNASADNKSVSGFLNFADRKVNAFPHFLSSSTKANPDTGSNSKKQQIFSISGMSPETDQSTDARVVSTTPEVELPPLLNNEKDEEGKLENAFSGASGIICTVRIKHSVTHF